MMAKCHKEATNKDLYDLNRFARFLTKRLLCIFISYHKCDVLLLFRFALSGL